MMITVVMMMIIKRNIVKLNEQASTAMDLKNRQECPVAKHIQEPETYLKTGLQRFLRPNKEVSPEG